MQHTPRKRFGQNFLIDQNIIEKIIQCIAPQAGQRIVEIGPGLGALTLPLLKAVKCLNVIEIDRDLIAKLEDSVKSFGQLLIHESDVLKFDFKALADNDNKIRIIGNLPYNISTPLLFYLLQYGEIIEDMVFMLQKEVVERLTAKPNTAAYGRLSVIAQFYWQVEHVFDVAATCFKPAPKVESAIVKLKPYIHAQLDQVNIDIFHSVVKKSFSQRRKTLRNNLKGILSINDIEKCGINPSVRAETLHLEEFLRLTQAFSANSSTRGH